MSRRSSTIDAGWFEALYRADPDPWRFRSSDYERGKYAATLAALARPRYGGALEIGCAIGVFTRQLAERCDRLLAIDGSATALAAARRECAACDNVSFAERVVPSGFPDGRYDLIVVSEVLYYLRGDDLATVAAQCSGALKPGGEIVLCHWLGETDYPLTGREATELFVATAVMRSLRWRPFSDDVFLLGRLQAQP